MIHRKPIKHYQSVYNPSLKKETTTNQERRRSYFIILLI